MDAVAGITAVGHHLAHRYPQADLGGPGAEQLLLRGECIAVAHHQPQAVPAPGHAAGIAAGHRRPQHSTRAHIDLGQLPVAGQRGVEPVAAGAERDVGRGSWQGDAAQQRVPPGIEQPDLAVGAVGRRRPSAVARQRQRGKVAGVGHADLLDQRHSPQVDDGDAVSAAQPDIDPVGRRRQRQQPLPAAGAAGRRPDLDLGHGPHHQRPRDLVDLDLVIQLHASEEAAADGIIGHVLRLVLQVELPDQRGRQRGHMGRHALGETTADRYRAAPHLIPIVAQGDDVVPGRDAVQFDRCLAQRRRPVEQHFGLIGGRGDHHRADLGLERFVPAAAGRQEGDQQPCPNGQLSLLLHRLPDKGQAQPEQPGRSR